MHLIDLFSKLIDSILMFLAVRCQLYVVLDLSLVQLFLQLCYVRLAPLRYLSLQTTHQEIT